MEIQQKDNETPSLCPSLQNKTASKWCVFDNDTVAICIFVKGLWDAHATVAKI